MEHDPYKQEAASLVQTMAEHADKMAYSDMLSWINHFLYSFALMENLAPQESRALLDTLHQYMNDKITTQEYQLCIQQVSDALQDTFDASTGKISIH